MNLNLDKFISRKLIVAITGFFGMLASGQYLAAAGLVVAYLAAQAHVDARSAAKVLREIGKDAEAVADQVDDAAAPLPPAVVVTPDPETLSAGRKVHPDGSSWWIAAPLPADTPPAAARIPGTPGGAS